MAIRFGPIDPLQLIFEILGALVDRKLLTYDEAEKLIEDSLDPSLSEDEKEKILDSLRSPTNPKKKKNDKENI